MGPPPVRAEMEWMSAPDLAEQEHLIKLLGRVQAHHLLARRRR